MRLHMKYITKIEDLIKLDPKESYILKNDIDCENIRVPCLCKYFSGRFFGAGHKIRNLILSNEVWGDEQKISLFGDMNRAEIDDVIFENFIMEYQKGCYKPRVGALASSCSDCTIKNVIMTVSNNSKQNTPMVYEVNDCLMQDNKIICNEKESIIAEYD